MQKKKLAIIINSLCRGGAEKIVSLIINNFYQEYEIHLLMLNPTIEFDLPYSEITVKTIDDSSLYAKNRTLDILKLPLLGLRLKRYLEKNEIEVCYSFLRRPNFITGFCKLLGWKGYAIISERQHTSSSYAPNSLTERIGHFLIKKLYRQADLVTSNSFGMEDDLKQNFGITNPSLVIYNPINIQEQELLAKHPIESLGVDKKFTFIIVGRLHEVKNHKLLFQAIKLLEKESFQVLVVGRGEIEGQLKELTRSLKIDKKVKFLGFKPNVYSYLARSHCFLMTSYSEGFPNALLEALASGIPVISTDCPTGPRELLTGVFDPTAHATDVEFAEYGILVPNNEVKPLANAMQRMLRDAKLRQHYTQKGKIRSLDFDQPVLISEFRQMLCDAFGTSMEKSPATTIENANSTIELAPQTPQISNVENA